MLNRPFNELRWHEQALRLLHNVWIDQQAFTHEIRPQLNAGHRYISQSVAGGGLAAIVLASVLGGLMMLIGISINWGLLWILLTLSLLVLLLVFRGDRGKQVPYYVVFAPIIGVALVVVMVAYGYTLAHEQEFKALNIPVLSRLFVLFIGFGMLLGVGYGLSSALKDGQIDHKRSSNQLQIALMGFILVGIIFYFLGPNQPNYPLGLLYLPASQVGLALGILLGGRWALRHAPPQTLQSQLDTQEPKE